MLQVGADQRGEVGPSVLKTLPGFGTTTSGGSTIQVHVTDYDHLNKPLRISQGFNLFSDQNQPIVTDETNYLSRVLLLERIGWRTNPPLSEMFLGFRKEPCGDCTSTHFACFRPWLIRNCRLYGDFFTIGRQSRLDSIIVGRDECRRTANSK